MKLSHTLIVTACASLATFAGLANAAPKSLAKNAYSLELQAMQDVNKQTDVFVKVTPNSNATALATVVKHVQLKSFSTAGDLHWTKNATNVNLTPDASVTSSVATFSYSEMSRFQPVQAQVQVQTGQTVSTEVLNTMVPVFLRPDLSVGEISMKDTVRVGEVVNISAIIKELNGDLGAQAKVVLRHGDKQLDQVNNVKLTAFGNAAAVFSSVFTEPGTYTLTVAIEGMNPGDYDVKNNQKNFTINVVNSVNPTLYSLYYSYWDGTTSTTYDGWYGNGSNTDTGVYQVTFGAIDLSGSDLALPAKASYSIRFDGKPELVNEGNVSGLDYINRWENGCWSGRGSVQSSGNGNWIYFNETVDCEGKKTISAQFVQAAANVIIFSERHNDYWGHNGTQTFENKFGSILRAQHSVQAHFIIEGVDGKQFGGDMAIVSLQGHPVDYSGEFMHDGVHYTHRQLGYSLSGYSAGTTEP